jgi:REP element-mobilizing transposase RayT
MERDGEVGRRVLPHDVPFGLRVSDEVFFLTICAQHRGAAPLIPVAARILEAVNFYEVSARWAAPVFLVMPDHVHGLVRFPDTGRLRETVRAWKRWTARNLGVDWQDGFFDHRLRHDESREAKVRYIVENPVRGGLVGKPEDWPFVRFGGWDGQRA